MSNLRSLTQEEARERAALIEVQRYDLELDMTGLASGDELRTSSTITFSATASGATTFADCLGEVEEAVLNGKPLEEGYIQNPAAQRGDKLALRERILQVQPAQHSIAGAGHVILHEGAADAVLGVAGKLVGFQEETALIAK